MTMRVTQASDGLSLVSVGARRCLEAGRYADDGRDVLLQPWNPQMYMETLRDSAARAYSTAKAAYNGTGLKAASADKWRELNRSTCDICGP